MTMYEVHAIQNVVVTEMKNRECALVNKVNSSHKYVNKMKNIVQEIEHKSKTWEDDKYRIDTAVTLACSIFTDEGIMLEMFS